MTWSASEEPGTHGVVVQEVEYAHVDQKIDIRLDIQNREHAVLGFGVEHGKIGVHRVSAQWSPRHR